MALMGTGMGGRSRGRQISIPGQSRLYSETLSQKKATTKNCVVPDYVVPADTDIINFVN